MIPRATVAAALGLPEATDALPPGDLPFDRFAARYLDYLSAPEAGAETPDAWTGAVMDHLVATRPDLALDAIRAGLAMDPDGLLADPLAELGMTEGDRVEEAARADPALAALVERANAAGG